MLNLHDFDNNSLLVCQLLQSRSHVCIHNRLYNCFLIIYWRSWWILKEISRCLLTWEYQVTCNNTYQIYIEYQEQWRLILTIQIIYVDVLKIKTDILWTLFRIPLKWTFKWTHTNIHVEYIDLMNSR